MPGLINTAMGGTNTLKMPKPDEFLGAGAVGYDPSKATVNADTDTVAGQLATMLSKPNALMLQEENAANEESNRRGMYNSSLGVEAGRSALIRSALPIASQDASTYSQQRLVNQGAENTAFQYGAGAENQANLTSAAAGNQAGRTAQAGVIQKELSSQEAGQAKALSAQQAEQQQGAIRVQAGEQSRLQSEAAQQVQSLQTLKGNLDTQLQTLKGTQAADIQAIDSQYKQLIGTSKNATDFYSGIVQQMSTIMTNADTTAEQKQAAIDSMTSMLRAGLSEIGSLGNVDLTGLLNFQGA